MSKHDEAKALIREANKDFENEYKKTVEALEKAVEGSAGSVGEIEAKLGRMDERQNEIQKSLDELNTDIKTSKFTHGSDKEDKLEADYSEIFKTKLMRSVGKERPSTLTDAEHKVMDEYEAARTKEMEAKGMNVGTANQGGHLVPTGDANEIMRQIEIKVPFFGISDVQDTDLAQTPVIIQTTVQSTVVGDETTEETDSTTPLVEEIRVPVFHFEAEPWISIELLEDSKLIDVQSFVEDDTVEALADNWGAKMVTGTGSGQPKGLLTSGGATSTHLIVKEVDATNGDNFSIGFDLDDLYTVKYDLNRRYKLGLSTAWVLGDQAMGGMRKMRDSNGQYLWQPSVTVGEPTNFDGEAIHFSPFMPTLTGASDEDAIIYGNFKKGHIILRRPDAMRVILDEVTNKKFLKVYRKIRGGSNVKDARALRILRTNAAV